MEHFSPPVTHFDPHICQADLISVNKGLLKTFPDKLYISLRKCRIVENNDGYSFIYAPGFGD